MEEIIVLTKHSCGNDMVGETKTILRSFVKDTPLCEVYEKMKELGNWDIVIPYSQEKA